jgi:CubicO group peptidase (beta-lactamase class C family)
MPEPVRRDFDRVTRDTGPLARRMLRSVAMVLALAACDSATEPILEQWPESTPAAQQLDATLLAELTRDIETKTYGTIHSLIVVRHGHIVWERYFDGWSSDDLHRVYSVTKSVISALVGIAEAGDLIPSMDASLLGYFPQYPTLAHPDPRKQQITLEQALMMRAGLQWDEFTVPYTDPSNSYRLMAASADWVKHVLDLPMVADPGTRFAYNTGVTVLLSAVLTAATGGTAEQYAAPRLFAPLGITRWDWDRTPQGVSDGGSGLWLRPRDMARFGYLFLNDGRLKNGRIVPASWVERSTRAYTGGAASYGYGYQWWTLPSSFRGADGTDPGAVFFAWGYGSQMIFVVPRFDMVVVTTGGNFSGSSDQPVSFLRTHIIPAVLDP